MASTTSQHPVPEAIDDFKQHQHGEIDPAVTSFLERRAHEIWQRTQAQPSTYVLTREEFAVVTYYRERLKDDEVVHQAVRRFWDHYNGSTPQAWDPGHLGSPEAHGVTNTHERTQVSFETREKQVESRISGKGQLTQGEHTPQTPEVHQRDSKSPENLYLDWARSVHTSNGEEYGLVNSIKIWVQSLTRESWDWWPLHPSFRRLREDEVRIKRYCVSQYPRCLSPGLLNPLKGFRARTLDCTLQDRARSFIRSFEEKSDRTACILGEEEANITVRRSPKREYKYKPKF